GPLPAGASTEIGRISLAGQQNPTAGSNHRVTGEVQHDGGTGKIGQTKETVGFDQQTSEGAEGPHTITDDRIAANSQVELALKAKDLVVAYQTTFIHQRLSEILFVGLGLIVPAVAVFPPKAASAGAGPI